MARTKSNKETKVANMNGSCTREEANLLKKFAEENDTTPSRIVRKAVLEYLERHGVTVE